MTAHGAPKPANFDALTAAAECGDAVRFAAEQAKYRQELVDAGIEPPPLRGWADENGDPEWEQQK